MSLVVIEMQVLSFRHAALANVGSSTVIVAKYSLADEILVSCIASQVISIPTSTSIQMIELIEESFGRLPILIDEKSMGIVILMGIVPTTNSTQDPASSLVYSLAPLP